MKFQRAHIRTDFNGDRYLEIFIDVNSITSSYVYYLEPPEGYDNSATFYRLNNLLSRLGFDYLVPLSFKDKISFFQLLGENL